MNGRIDYTSPNQLPIPIGNSDGAKTVAHWFGNDIQYSAESACRWSDLFSKVANGSHEPGYLGSGNAHSVSATTQLVYIESEFVEAHKVCLTIDQIFEALDKYKLFLSSDYRSPTFQPVPFDVEYVAEGEQALGHFLREGGSLV
jgi:hypothetical protein